MARPHRGARPGHPQQGRTDADGRHFDVVRPGATDFFVPVEALREARLDKGIAGKVLTEGGLLVVTWEHGGKLLDSGFRSDRAAEHNEWVETLNQMINKTETEGAR